jgi:hypothetical protein
LIVPISFGQISLKKSPRSFPAMVRRKVTTYWRSSVTSSIGSVI